MRIRRKIRMACVCVPVTLFIVWLIPVDVMIGSAFGQAAQSYPQDDKNSQLTGADVSGQSANASGDAFADARDEKREAIVKSALALVGSPYRFGGSDPRRGFDCCGFVMYVYKLNSIILPRTSGSQFLSGKYIEKKDVRKGDLLFWRIPKGRISHVGIYIGDGKFVHSPVPGKRVRIENLEETYWRKYYFGAATYLE